MKKILLPVLGAIAAIGAAAGTAQAQPYGPPPGAYAHPAAFSIGQRIHWIQERISRGRAAGALDWREFRRVQGELNGVKREFNRDRFFNAGGLDGPTRANLEAKLNTINAQIHWIHEINEARPW